MFITGLKELTIPESVTSLDVQVGLGDTSLSLQTQARLKSFGYTYGF